MKKIYIAFSFGLIINQLAAQSGALGYGSQSYISANSSNPALGGKDVKFVFGLGNFNFDATTSFTLNDLLTKSGTKTVLNLGTFASKLAATNNFGMDITSDLAHIGFNLKGFYVSAGAQLSSNTQVTFSNSAIKLIAEGNLKNPNVALTGESIYNQSFISTYLGLSRSFMNDKLSIGVRLKQISGIGHLETTKLNYTIKTDANSYPQYALQIKSDVNIQAGGIFATTLDALGDSAKRATLANDITANPVTGSGFGLDFGVAYQLNDKISISASALNLGSINWKQENGVTAKAQGSGTFDWKGMSYRVGASDNATFNSDSVIKLAKNALIPGMTKTAYSSSLPSAFYLGVSYQLSKKQQISVVYRTQTAGQVTNTLLGANYRLQLLKSLQVSAGVSLPSNTAMTFGGGFVWSPGPVQLYLMTDNLSSADNGHRMHIQAGLNIVLRKKKDAVTLETPIAPEPPKPDKPK
ncbi:MAG: hypothetical protein RIS64_2242 [Bacteroidota bacterium]|jgi:hypothetical protein